MEKITTKKFNKIMSNGMTKMRVAIELGVNYQTLDGWIRGQHEKLTYANTLETIHKVTGLTMYDVLIKYQNGTYKHHIKK